MEPVAKPAATRPTAVAGMFYPGDASELQRAVETCLMDAPEIPAHPKALIVPHAGYIYSGAIAGRGFGLLKSDAAAIHRIVLLGPAHRKYVRGLAAPSVNAFATPLGPVTVDQGAIATLRDLPYVIIDDEAHALEHSLEVQLPFLKRVAPNAALVPLAVGEARPEEVAAVIERLWGGAETRVIVSSDLSHYLPYDTARMTDLGTARLIEQFQGDQVGPTQACGCFAIAGLLRAAKRHGLSVTRVDLRNSGDTAGPRDRVVGYGAWALSGAL